MTHAEAVANYNSYRAAKADPTKTNAEIVTRHNQLYEKQRLLKMAGNVDELKAENARLKAELASKGKAAGRAA